MRPSANKLVATVLFAVSSVLSTPSMAPAGEVIYLLTATNELLRADTDDPGSTLSSVPITGLAEGESVLGIDFRDAGGDELLYLLGSSNRLYVMPNPEEGKAVAVGTTFSPGLRGSEFGFDVDPQTDQIRVVSDENQSFDLDPASGQVIGAIWSDVYIDAYAVVEPSLVGAAYAHRSGGSVRSQIFMIDAGLDLLVSPDGRVRGEVTGIGPLGLDAADMLGFDISSVSGLAYAGLDVGGRISLYSIDLETGRASVLGDFGPGTRVRAMSISGQPVPVPVVRMSWGELKGSYR